MTSNLLIIHVNVKHLLEKYPELREPTMRKQAHIKYWQEYEGVGNFGITISEYPKLTSAETISRAIRKIQEINPKLRPTAQGREIQRQQEEQFRKEYKKYHCPKCGGAVMGENDLCPDCI